MDPWTRHVRRCRDRAGVGTRAQAAEVDVSPATWGRRVRAEGWARPYDGVAIAPWASDPDTAVLAAVAAAHGGAAGAETSRWLHGHGPRPRRLEVVIPHGRSVRTVRPDPSAPPPRPASSDDEDDAATSRNDAQADAESRAQREERRRWHARCRRVRVRRCRWWSVDETVLVRGVPTLTPVATAIALAADHPEDVRPFLVDARHARSFDLDDVRERLRTVGSVRGRHVIVAALEALADRGPESPFHDEVLSELERRGYAPSRHPVRLSTPRGVELLPDIVLQRWKIPVELDGDRFHRDREQRRRDRDRASGYASIGWPLLVLDHRIWTTDRARFFADLDATIEVRRRAGIGDDVPPPRVLGA